MISTTSAQDTLTAVTLCVTSALIGYVSCAGSQSLKLNLVFNSVFGFCKSMGGGGFYSSARDIDPPPKFSKKFHKKNLVRCIR